MSFKDFSGSASSKIQKSLSRAHALNPESKTDHTVSSLFIVKVPAFDFLGTLPASGI